jgi:hypothetical protein
MGYNSLIFNTIRPIISRQTMSKRLLIFCLFAWSVMAVSGFGLADEILIENRSVQDDSSSSETREIRAGELWQFFHDRGVTSVDTIKLNLQSPSLSNDLSGTVRFEIEDPHSGVISNHMIFDPRSGHLEIPMGFDLMSRFSSDSQELIKLDFSGIKSMKGDTNIMLDTGAERVRSLNFAILVGFILFWLAVFFFLYRLTKPTATVVMEEIILRQANDVESLYDLKETETNPEMPRAQNYARVVTAIRTTGQSSAAAAR